MLTPSAVRTPATDACTATRGRSGNYPAFEVVGAVVASAPDFAARFQVLYGAVEVCADGGEGLPLGVVDPNQDGWFIAEFDDLAGVRLEVLHFAGVDFVDGDLSNPRRVEETRDGVEERRERGGDTAAKKPGDERAPAGIGRRCGGIPLHPTIPFGAARR